MKTCAKCKIEQPYSAFCRASRSKDGYYCYCRKCQSEQSKRYHTANLERVRRRNREWNVAHAEDLRIKNAKRYHENSARYRQVAKKWRDANKQSISVRNKRWKKENPHLRLQYVHKRRYLILSNTPSGNHFTAEEFVVLCERFGSVCVCCGEGSKLTADHVVPIVHGGSNAIDNIQPLCLPCNVHKAMQCIDYRLKYKEV